MDLTKAFDYLLLVLELNLFCSSLLISILFYLHCVLVSSVVGLKISLYHLAKTKTITQKKAARKPEIRFIFKYIDHKVT